MDKKYKLIVPEMIRKEDGYLTEQLPDNTVLVFQQSANKRNYVCVYVDKSDPLFEQCKELQFCFPEDWLQEIKEPMTAEEWINGVVIESENISHEYSLREMAIKAFTAGEANERLKHEPKQSVLEAFKSLHPNLRPEGAFEYFDLGWHANEKNRGFESEKNNG